jgi:hypothetical protein
MVGFLGQLTQINHIIHNEKHMTFEFNMTQINHKLKTNWAINPCLFSLINQINHEDVVNYIIWVAWTSYKFSKNLRNLSTNELISWFYVQSNVINKNHGFSLCNFILKHYYNLITYQNIPSFLSHKCIYVNKYYITNN